MVRRQAAISIGPESFEAICGQLGIAYCVLNIFVPQEML
jgi:hypothetical protein